MEEIFKAQLENDWTRVVTFVEINDKGPDQVRSWKKSKLDTLKESFEYIGTDKGRLPRFVSVVA